MAKKTEGKKNRDKRDGKGAADKRGKVAKKTVGAGAKNESGRPAVLLCCHRQDEDIYSERLSKELERATDCKAVFWKAVLEAKNAAETEEYISGMQLVVIAVTTRLIFEKNNCEITEKLPNLIDCCRSLHIPVIALLQESGLEWYFSERYSGVAYLVNDNNVDDLTKYTYSDGLRGFMEEALGSRALLGRVRDLMRGDFVQKIEAAELDEEGSAGLDADSQTKVSEREASVDDSEGEGDDSAEGEAKARALSLSPEEKLLLGLAKINGMLGQPDREKGAKLVVQAAEAENAEACMRMEAMCRNGVAVECDFEAAEAWCDRAKALLWEAAETQRSEESIARYADKIAEIGNRRYFAGDGSGAIAIHIEMIENLRKLERKAVVTEEIDEDVDGKADNDIVEEIGEEADGAEKASEGSKTDERAEIDEGTLTDEDALESVRRAELLSLVFCGGIERKLGRMEEARARYEEGLTLFKSLERRDLRAYTAAADANMGMGAVWLFCGNRAEAKLCYERTASLMEKVLDETDGNASARGAGANGGDAEVRDSEKSLIYKRMALTASAHICKGDMDFEEGGAEAALTAYEKAVGLAEKAMKTTGQEGAHYLLSLACGRVAMVHRSRGEMEEYAEYNRRSLESLELLSESSNTFSSLKNLVMAHMGSASLRFEEGNVEAGLYHCATGIELMERMAGETGALDSMNTLEIVYGKAVEVCFAMGLVDNAVKYIETYSNTAEEVGNMIGSVDGMRIIDSCYYKHGCMLASAEGLEERVRLRGIDFLKKSENLRKEMAEATKESADYMNYAQVLDTLGDYYYILGYADEAEDYFAATLTVMEKLCGMEGAGGFAALGTNSRKKGAKKSKAKGKAQTDGTSDYAAGDIAGDRAIKAHVEEAQGPISKYDRQRDLVYLHSKLAELHRVTGKLGEVQKHFRRIIDIRELLAKDENSFQAKRELAYGYKSMGDIDFELGKKKTAMECYERFLELSETLTEEADVPEVKSDIMIANGKIGDVYLSDGKTKDARERFERCCEICDSLEDKVSENQLESWRAYYRSKLREAE